MQMIIFWNLLFILFPALVVTHPHRSHTLAPRKLAESGDFSFLPSYFTLENVFTFYFDILQNSIVITIQFNTPNQFFAIGFGTDMTNADMWVFEIDGGTVTTGDFWSTGELTPVADVTLGGNDNIDLIGFAIFENSTIVKFQRALSTGDIFDTVITPGENSMIWATRPGSLVLAQHTTGNYGSFVGTIEDGYTGPALVNTDLTFLHGIAMFICWAGLFDVILILSRLLRLKRGKLSYLKIHMIIMMIVYLTTVGSIVYMNYSQTQVRSSFWPTSTLRIFHACIGYAILFFATLGFLLGYKTYIGLTKPYTGEGYIFSKTLHRILGGINYLLSRVNLIIGSQFSSNSFFGTPILIILGALLFVHIAFAIWHSRRRDQPVELRTYISTTTDHVELMRMIISNQPREYIFASFPEIKWCFFDDFVLDITHFLHPGGVKLIDECIGREISRFIYGSYMVERVQKIKPHLHSSDAFRVMQDCIIGRMKGVESPFIYKDGNKTRSDYTSDWKLIHRREINKYISRFDFDSPDYEVIPFFEGYRAFGRSVTIKAKANSSSIKRNYSIALSMTDENIKIREIVFDALESNKKLHLASNLIYPKSFFSLYIKRYNTQSGFSKLVHSLHGKDKEDFLFQIDGPDGRGLEVNPFKKGVIVILVVGTGILPFLDFFHYLFLKTIYEIFKDRRNDNVKKMKTLGFDFEDAFEGLKIKFFGIFVRENEIIGLDLIKKFAKLSRVYKRDIFEAKTTAYSDDYVGQIKGRIGNALLKTVVDKNVLGYYICGSPGFNFEISKLLTDKFGVEKSKIYHI